MDKTTLYSFYFFSLFLISTLLFSSCTAFEGEQTIPAYIHIDTILLTPNPDVQGSNSNKITDAWVYIDDELVGTFEMPCTFPVLKTGKHNIKVLAGIKMNGIASTRVYYPYYKAYTTDITLTEEETDTLRPIVSYYPSTKFVWIEDFENGGSSFERTSRSDTILEVTTNPSLVFEGDYSGAIYLGDSALIFEVSSLEGFVLPKTQPVFLELNYKTNNYLTVGILGNTPGQVVQTSVMVLNHTSKWNKVYINLTADIGQISDASDFKIFIGMLREEGVEHPEAFIDNIKLVTF